MKRREFLGLLGGTAAAWPLGVRAQQAKKIPRIGWIILGWRAGGVTDVFSYYDSFRAGLNALGYVEGSKLARSAEGVPERLPSLIDELLSEDCLRNRLAWPRDTSRSRKDQIDPSRLRFQWRSCCRWLCRYIVAWERRI